MPDIKRTGIPIPRDTPKGKCGKCGTVVYSVRAKPRGYLITVESDGLLHQPRCNGHRGQPVEKRQRHGN